MFDREGGRPAPQGATFGRGSVGTAATGSVSYGRGSGGSAAGGSGDARSGSGSGGGDSSSHGKTRGTVRKDFGTIHRDLHTRPDGLDKKGSSGDPVKCSVNFVRILSDLNSTVCQYHVGFEPEIDSKQMRIELVRKQCNEITGEFVIFDGMILYMPRCITAAENFTVKHPLTDEPVKVNFRLSVTFGRNDPQAINIYNLLIRDAFKACGFVQVQRNFFDPRKSHDVKNFGVEIWPGYETAVRMYEEEMMLCIENRFKVLRTQSVYVQLREEYGRAKGNMDLLKVNCDNTYTGQTVLTLYNNRMHRLSRFAWDMNPLSTFHHAASGKQMTFKEYYQSQYNVVIKDGNQPLIISEGKPKQPGEDPQVTYLIPELCQVTGLTDTMRKDTKTMKVMSNFTRLTPESRRESTIHFLDLVRENKEVSRLFDAWHVHLDDKLVEMQARRLPAEGLYGRSERNRYVGQKAEWARDVKGNGNFRTVPLEDWIVLCPDEPDSTKEAMKFINECKTIGRQMNMTVADPLKWVASDPDASVYNSATQAALAQFQNETGRQAKMVVVIVNDDNKTRYDTLKKTLCHDMPVPSQMVLLQTLTGRYGENKAYGSIVLKILLQINCKMGGAIWKVAIPLKNSMICGYDLYHDSTMKGKTIGACVSSYDTDYTKFFSQTLPHVNPTELGENLREFIKRALQRYYETNNALPERLMIYRDGCGDGQIPLVKDNEVRQVKEASEEVGRSLGIDYTPMMSFIVITKKVNMRVFKHAPTPNGTQLTNPDPGTVVDSVVTRPERYDFYLVPQFVNQGTVTPVCYNVLHDTTGLTPDQQQKLAFKLCHLYYNWQGTVRVPAPCQYAHKLAFLVAQTLHKESHDSLRDRLFFL